MWRGVGARSVSARRLANTEGVRGTAVAGVQSPRMRMTSPGVSSAGMSPLLIGGMWRCSTSGFLAIADGGSGPHAVEDRTRFLCSI